MRRRIEVHRPDDNINTEKSSVFPGCSTTSLFSPEEWESLSCEFHDWTKDVEIEARNTLEEEGCPNPLQSYREIRGSSDEFFPGRNRKSQSQGNLNNDDETNSIYSGCIGLFSDWELRKLELQFPDSPPSEWPDNSPSEDGRRLPEGLTAVTEKPPHQRSMAINMRQKKEPTCHSRKLLPHERPLPDGWKLTEKIREATGKKDRVLVELSTLRKFQSFRSAWEYIDRKKQNARQ